MRLDEIITALEEQSRHIEIALGELRGAAAVAKTPLDTKPRRGRKAMSETERAEVSERMKRYWAKRRRTRAGAAGA